MSFNYSVYTEEELAGLLHERDELAFAEVYNRYWAPLLNHARRMLNDQQEAEDVVQDIFSGLFLNMGTAKGPRKLSAYLFHAARNRVLDIFDKQSTRQKYVDSLEIFLSNDYQTPEDLFREREMERLIEFEIGQLPPKMRAIFELSRKKHLSYKQIASEINGTEDNVRKQVYNALKLLRSKLTAYFFLQVMAFILWLNR
jgi:RNA polymerase sigma-70 factor (ECF subfamily)